MPSDTPTGLQSYYNYTTEREREKKTRWEAMSRQKDRETDSKETDGQTYRSYSGNKNAGLGSFAEGSRVVIRHDRSIESLRKIGRTHKDIQGYARKMCFPLYPDFCSKKAAPLCLALQVLVLPGFTKLWIQGTSAQRQNFAIDMAGLHKARWKVHRELHKSRSGRLDHSDISG